MIKIEKPGMHKKGLKILVYGDTGVGKTIFALSFPKSLVFDSEDGYEWYESTDKAKNMVGIVRSQSFEDLSELMEDLNQGPDNYRTLVIDSETKIYENLQEALLDVEERRARKKHREELDANISQRSWGKIKQNALRLQNDKIRLASKGINIVSVSQSADVMEKAGDNTMVKIGEKPDMHKKAKYDYDIKLLLFVKDNKYYGKVEKDRTGLYEVGTILENPSYENWKDKVEGKANQGETKDVDFAKDVDQSKKAYEKHLKNEMTFEERVMDYAGTLSKEEQKEFVAKMSEIAGTNKFKEMSDEAKKKISDTLLP